MVWTRESNKIEETSLGIGPYPVGKMYVKKNETKTCSSRVKINNHLRAVFKLKQFCDKLPMYILFTPINTVDTNSFWARAVLIWGDTFGSHFGLSEPRQIGIPGPALVKIENRADFFERTYRPFDKVY